MKSINIILIALLGFMSGCDGENKGSTTSTTVMVTVSASPAGAGVFTSQNISVIAGAKAQVGITPKNGYRLKNVSGCGEEKTFSQSGLTTENYQTGAINGNCSLVVTFEEVISHSPELHTLIAHAGGGLNGRAYRNSKEAMDLNYSLGLRLFEMDFSWTSDNKMVAIHDWGIMYKTLFPYADHSTVPDFDTFVNFEMAGGETQLTLAGMKAWLEDHPDAYIVTDIKENNVAGLRSMKEAFGEQYLQVIPQIYEPSNYQPIKDMGYLNIIFTLYVTSLPTSEIIDKINELDLFAVTVSPHKFEFQKILDASIAANKFVYVHTYNTVAEYEYFMDLGVGGLYTDYLYFDNGSIYTQ